MALEAFLGKDVVMSEQTRPTIETKNAGIERPRGTELPSWGESPEKDVSMRRDSDRPDRRELPSLKEDKKLETLWDKISDLSSQKEQLIEGVDEPESQKDVNPPIQNKIDGMERENKVKQELEKKYPAEDGHEIVSEAYLRDKDGNIVKDPETNSARRIDFVVVKDGKVVDSVEVTSKTASKEEQSAKEERIRENGGCYIKDSSGNLIRIPDNVKTRIERRD